MASTVQSSSIQLADSTPTPTPTTITAQNLPPHPPPRDNPKKRPLDTVHFHESPYFKMRGVLKDLRPLFLEVIQSPDFRDSKAAIGIQEKMKLMLDLCRQMAVDTMPDVKCNNGPGSGALSAENHDMKKPIERQQQDTKPGEHQEARTFVKPAEARQFPSGDNPEKLLPENFQKQGKYTVGGSAFGWNFILFHEIASPGKCKRRICKANARSRGYFTTSSELPRTLADVFCQQLRVSVEEESMKSTSMVGRRHGAWVSLCRSLYHGFQLVQVLQAIRTATPFLGAQLNCFWRYSRFILK
ncbi:hypothetical protein Nepgr_024317 [Nepenthes gracilis]|uniref:Uncharacterized protein n=1 Tax=Nepenthes gracilis TaxID=150966 RepID=A0AAD3T4Z2_NEPGR|nr:hypothetical protein Nepgr_024317 [Nepenthes gracilis]